MADRHVVQFYDDHPITAAQVLEKVQAARGTLDGPSAADLWPHDQDHYGGLDANDALAAAAGMRPGDRVLDLCAGLCGPARHNVVVRGVEVTAVDLNAKRCGGARDLNARVGLAGRIAVIEADVTAPPVPDGAFDIAWSQEAFLHIADKPRLLAAARRALRTGGRLAFTDWTAGPGLTTDDRALMSTGIAAKAIHTPAEYGALLSAAGFDSIAHEDVSVLWKPILRARLEMYRGLREEARRGSGADPHADYVRFYERFVDLVVSGRLGGARFVAAA
ncbi:MAG: methyltransferase domain-containing protein [Rhodospirillales bacterium]|nr:methyltransferase domain-containing protein [Rhodospirillales bacterium]